MRMIESSEAKVHLSKLLDDVERGETILITRHGRPIARLAPEVDRRRGKIKQTMAEIEAFSRDHAAAHSRRDPVRPARPLT